MQNKKTARQERKARTMRVIALFACCALLLTAILPYLVGMR